LTGYAQLCAKTARSHGQGSQQVAESVEPPAARAKIRTTIRQYQLAATTAGFGEGGVTQAVGAPRELNSVDDRTAYVPLMRRQSYTSPPQIIPPDRRLGHLARSRLLINLAIFYPVRSAPRAEDIAPTTAWSIPIALAKPSAHCASSDKKRQRRAAPTHLT
jgi:hypothetical protein